MALVNTGTTSTGFVGAQSFSGDVNLGNFPAVLQSLLQGGFLVREMEEGLDSVLAYRRVAIQETFPARVGEAMTRTRKGRLAPVTAQITPYATTTPATTSGLLDNGLLPQVWSIEQYTAVLGLYAATQDLNLVAEQAQIADQFIANARNNGIQAAQSLERICRLKLFGAYMSGNTAVITRPTTATTSTQPTANTANYQTANPVASVVDLRGFMFTLVNGQLSAVSATNSIPVTIVNAAGVVITGMSVVGAAPFAQAGGTAVTNVGGQTNTGGIYATGKGPSDITSLPDAQGVGTYVTPSIGTPLPPSVPIPGLLQFSGTPSSNSNITAGDAIIASAAPQIFRPNGRSQAGALTGGDLLSLAILEDVTAYMRDNGIPAMPDGTFHIILDNTGMRQLFADPQFMTLYAGRSQSPEYREQEIIRLAGMTFVATTESPIQVPSPATTDKDTNFPSSGFASKVRRAIVVGAEALIQANFEGMESYLADRGFDRNDSRVAMVDGVVQIVREPLDRLQQIVSMSWMWIGDYVVPTDSTATNTIIPTASNAMYKRAAIVEFAG